ncbi:DNA polymerase III subunit delta [Canibacter sp. lx-72]|uniref:DNA polymerase III subunit delta n=1 Tax=Canibacter zhuwentaonis TaxID=2837491 RepID=UPI001BDD662A|nr:DNA polymerase III subunit delta [Canibacter zhuwentaonis]MBT1017903.1 DNA polymerase III subunit delta [Canibacter zhuwentaonis]MBT1035065.1 DNA polymerase III subunit delta [Canibacter zhuwentaonis]
MSRAAANSVAYDSVRIAEVTLLYGKETVLADRAARQITELLRKEYPNLVTHEISAAEYSRGTLLTFATPSLFGEPRLIKISDLDRASACFTEEFAQTTSQLDGETFFLLQHPGGVSGKAVLRQVRQTAGLIEVNCAKVELSERPNIITREAKRLGVRIAAEPLRQLSSAFTTDLGELFAALEQLAHHAVNCEITLQSVQDLTAGRVETSVFAVIDAALNGDVAQTMILIRHALHTGIDPVFIVAMINRSLRDLARVHGRAEPVQQLAKELGMPPWMVDKVRRRAAKWQRTNLAKVILQATETDMAVKGFAKDPEYALERLLLTVAVRGNI